MRASALLLIVAVLATAAPAAAQSPGFQTSLEVAIAPFEAPLANGTSHTTPVEVTYRYPVGAFATQSTRATLAIGDYPDWGHAVVEPDVIEFPVPATPATNNGAETVTVNLTLHLAEAAPANATFNYTVVARAEQNDAMQPSEGEGAVGMQVLYVPPPPVNDTVEVEDEGFLGIPAPPAAAVLAALGAAAAGRRRRGRR